MDLVKMKITVELEMTVPAHEYQDSQDPVLIETQTLSDRGLASYLGYLDSAGNVTYRGIQITRL